MLSDLYKNTSPKKIDRFFKKEFWLTSSKSLKREFRKQSIHFKRNFPIWLNTTKQKSKETYSYFKNLEKEDIKELFSKRSLERFSKFAYQMETRQKINFSVIMLLIVGAMGIIRHNQNTMVSDAVFRRSVLSSWDYTSQRNLSGMRTKLKKGKTALAVLIERDKSSIEFELPINNPSLRVKDGLATYTNDDESIEIKYEIQPTKVKESIILNVPTTKNKFTSNFVINNLNIKISDEKTPIFFDKRDNYQFHLEKPYAIDASGNKTFDLSYELKPKTRSIGENPFKQRSYTPGENLLRVAGLHDVKVNDNEYELVVSVDPQWLSSPKRKYPIIIDPTVTHDTTAEFAVGIFNRLTDTGSGSSPVLETYYQELAADENTVGLWHLNEASGNASDSSGNGNTGTPTGTTVISGLLNNARSFNGSSDYINIGDVDTIDTTNTLSGCAWVYNDSIAADHAIISKLGGGSGDGIYFYRDDTGIDSGRTDVYSIYIGNTGDSNEARLESPQNSTPINTWNNICFTFEAGSPTGLHLYINGKEVADSPISTTSISSIDSTTNPLRIGGYSGGGSSFAGDIDEVIISTKIFTPEEIRAAASRRSYSVYTSPVIDFGANVTSWASFNWTENGVATGDGETPSSATGLVAQWNFNETSGTTADNAEGTAALDGTLSGFDSTASQDADADSSWTANNKRWGAGALQFDGINSYTYCADASCGGTGKLDFLDSESFSYGAWFKTSKSDAAQVIMSKQTTYNASAGWSMWIFTDNKVYCNTHDGTDNAWAASTTTVNDGEWHYAVCNINHSTQETNVYLDGVYENLSYISTINSLDTTSDFRTGSQGSGGTYFSGIIDSVQVYSRVLPASEVLSLYNSANIELQTRVGADSSPDDGSWDNWLGVSGETAIASMDSDASNWSWGNNATYIPQAKSNESNIKIEGTGGLKQVLGKTQVDGNTIALWNLNETNGDNAGDDVFDETSNNHDGEFVGSNIATAVAGGISGKSRTFNSTDDYIDITNSIDFDLQNLTIEAWVYSDDFEQNMFIFEKGPVNTQYSCFFEGANIKFRTYNTTPTIDDLTIDSSDAGIVPNQWNHVACVYDGTTKRIYINSKEAGSKAYSETLQTGQSGQRIGAYGGGTPAYFFDGSIDEVRISSIARSQEEVEESYRMGRDHYLSKTISSTNLSSKTSIPFYIAADRPGTYLESIIGESAYANYQPDTNTVGLWHLEETARPLSPGSTFSYTGSSQTYTVPAGITSIEVKLWGAGGGGGGDTDSGASGGGGAYSFATLGVTPGEDLIIHVGGGGTNGTSCVTSTGGGAGGGGAYGTGARGGHAGGTGCSAGGGGGGSGSFVLRSSTVLAGAGGGGGGGGGETAVGGAGGGGGVNGSNGNCSSTGGTTGGSGSANGTQGGDQGGGDGSGSGGGGGGVAGGTGGTRPTCDGSGGAGGAGGSNLGDTVNNGSGITPGNSSDPERNSAGTGGTLYISGWDGRALVSPVRENPLKDSSSDSNHAILAAKSAGITTATTTLSYTGGSQAYVVPTGVTAVAIKMWGGGGGGGGDADSGASGGGGAYTYSVLSVTPGESLNVHVGGGGGGGTGCVTSTGGGSAGSGASGTGGRGGHAGGTGCSAGGGGGGAGSFVLRGTSVLAAAGGGGGGGGGETSVGGGGGGGGVAGSNGSCSSVGGATGTNTTVNGTQGGDQGGGDGSGSGGGGGGFYGGKGGTRPTCDASGGAGGGGGGNLGDTTTNGSGTTPGNSSDPDRSGAGNGGVLSTGGTNGRVLVYATKMPSAQGSIGKGINFNGASDYIEVADDDDLDGFTATTLESWIFPDTAHSGGIMRKENSYLFRTNSDNTILCRLYLTGAWSTSTYSTALIVPGQWNHVACAWDGSTIRYYINGKEDSSTISDSGTMANGTTGVRFGINWSSAYFDGTMDEIRISKVARTASEIRQTYELGLRTHSITIDFGASLDSGNLITGSGDTSFTIDATTHGLNTKGSALYKGDKIIVKENYSGTEYIAQGTVTAVTPSTGAVTVVSWDSGGTFPTGGYTANASVFKWQREYWPIADNTLSTHMDGITNITFRLTNGHEGRTIWIDDFRSNGNYLTNPLGSTILSSTGKQYFQYRSIFTSNDYFVSPSLSSVSIASNTDGPTLTPTPSPTITPTPSPTPFPMDVLNGESDGANSCYLEESPQDTEVIVHWTDGATDEIGYEIERQTNGAAVWQTIDITSPNAVSYNDDSVSSGYIYRYKVRKRTDDGGVGEWCGTPLVYMQTGSYQSEGLTIDGVRLD